MSMVIKILAEGQLPSTLGDLYTVPTNTRAIIKTITCLNNRSGDETIKLYIQKSGGTNRQIIGGVLLADGGYMVCDSEFTLGAGDKIRGITTTANIVDYTISGVEEVS